MLFWTNSWTSSSRYKRRCLRSTSPLTHDGSEHTGSPFLRLVGPLVRFYAHLVLALRSLGEAVPDVAANAILQAYLKVLEMEGNDHLVAAYAACLRQGSGEESYARFLRGEQRLPSLFWGIT